MDKNAILKELQTERDFATELWRMLKDFGTIREKADIETWANIIARGEQLRAMGKTPEFQKLALAVSLAVIEYLDSRCG